MASRCHAAMLIAAAAATLPPPMPPPLISAMLPLFDATRCFHFFTPMPLALPPYS